MEENTIKSPILEAESNLHDTKGTENREHYSLGESAFIQESYQGEGHSHSVRDTHTVYSGEAATIIQIPQRSHAGITLQGHGNQSSSVGKPYN